MYNFKPHEYYTDIFKFLRNEDGNGINLKRLFLYIFAVIATAIIGQIIVHNSDPYKSDNIENEKFIKDEIKRQIITDTITLPMVQTCFNNYSVIKLANDSSYLINLVSSQNEDKITKNAVIEKKANDKIFEIINNNIRYKFEILELSNFPINVFTLLATLFFSIIGIPLWIKQNELEKEHEKNSR